MAVPARRGGRLSRCTVGVVLSQLDEETASALRAALNSTATNVAIAQVLQKWGLHVGHDSIQKHRRPSCKCPR